MSDRPQYPQYPGDDSQGRDVPPQSPQGPPPPTYGQVPPPPAYGQEPPSWGQAPPPPAYGQAPGYPPPGYGAQPAGYPPAPGYAPAPGLGQGSGQLASWWSRVGASLLDGLITLGVFLVPFIVGAVIAFANAETDPLTDEITGGVEPAGIIIMILSVLFYVGFDIWNRGVRVGTRGQSLGKQVVGIRIVHGDTGQLLGGGTGFLRWLMSFLFGIISCVALIDVLWPLWDERNQTLHDKTVGSVALRA